MPAIRWTDWHDEGRVLTRRGLGIGKWNMILSSSKGLDKLHGRLGVRLMFVTEDTLEEALRNLYGSAGHLIKIWFTLKHMGLRPGGPPVRIDTNNSTPSLIRLFSYGSPDGDYFIPFAHTPRYLTIKPDASRSIIQTNIQRWATSGSVVTCDPTGFLDFSVDEDNKILVKTKPQYPLGLGFGESGFALKEDAVVRIPIRSFAVWYGRQTNIPPGVAPGDFLVEQMLEELHITQAERAVIFNEDDNLVIETQAQPLQDSEIYAICRRFINQEIRPEVSIHLEQFTDYTRRLNSVVSRLDLPEWLRTSPAGDLKGLLDSGAKVILLYGPPRTGKTRGIDLIIPRNSPDRCTIQIHDGWGYDHLIEGLKPNPDGSWTWTDGPLKKAIKNHTKYIVLEEINRTLISQALGEVFSLLEESYRGEENAIVLRSGEQFWIPEDVVFLMTMNTIDKSTEELDDALWGRVAAVEFPPRAEDLNEMLVHNGVPEAVRKKVAELFAEIQRVYPLGHGYFAGLPGAAVSADVIRYYKARIRPVLANHLGTLRVEELIKIDNLVSELFGEGL